MTLDQTTVTKSPSLPLDNKHAQDSFFNRVFGHHSQDSSRAGSPLHLNTPRPTQTVSTSTVQRRHHARNSSTSSIPAMDTSSSASIHTPTSKPSPTTRRRSFDLATPHPTVSFQETPQPDKKYDPVPFPRGGRQIGASHIPPPYTSKSIPRSNSADHQDAPPPVKDKKRHHIFGRFSKKKSRNELNHVPPQSTHSSISSQSSAAPSLSSSISNSRKRSNDAEMFRTPQAPHPLDPDDFTRPSVHRPSYFSTNTMSSSASATSSNSERKRSAGQQSGKKLSKDREKSDGSIFYDTRARKDTKEIELDQNFGTMDGIVNPNYKHVQPHPSSVLRDHYTEAPSPSVEAWAPPESWGVQPAGNFSTSDLTTNALVDEDTHDLDEYTMVDQDKWDAKKKNYCIRIFRPDETFGTLQVALNTNTSELMQKLAGKFFLPDMTKYNLILRRNNLERVLGGNERPLQIQKTLLEQMGYTEDDKIEDIGREDNSYLLRFTFGPNINQTISQDDADLGAHIDLQARNLPTIPIFLFKQASRIVSLDVSRNLMIEIPEDFVQLCKNLQQLRLTNNDYVTVPMSTHKIKSLKQLNLSGNRLRELDHARLHEIHDLRALRVYNNRLDTLPPSFTSFTHLTGLYISNNSFTTFPEVICQIVSLESLDISFNKISMFPDEIGNLIRLETLSATANRVNGPLPPSFAKLQELRELDVRQNFITDLEVLCHLPKLELLSVDYNAISIANYDFLHLRRLKMYKNHLTQFALYREPPSVPSRLTELNLSNCKLSSLPDDLFVHAHLLEHLVLDSNTLTCIPTSIGALSKLVRLSVQNNALESLPVEIAKLSELKILDAQKNNLKTLPKEIWLCPSLQVLNCSSNLLESFPEPYSVPGVALHLPLTPQGEAVVSSINANDQHVPMGTNNAGQGIIPIANGQFNPPLSATATTSSSSSSLSSSSSFHSITATMSSTGLAHATATPSSLLPPNKTLHAVQTASGNGISPLTFTDTKKRTSSNPPQPMTPVGTDHAPPPNFNPPSFFASPRNHPPPLSLTLRQLYLGDNRLTDDDVWMPLSLFLELRTLNLSFNDLYEIPPEALCHQHLYELYLSGNQLTSLPADDIERLTYLRVLAVNGNKLQTLPAEIGKLRKLLVLDVGNNLLKYNISNWPYDWNWNWNLGLKYLNLSGNKRLEIKKQQHTDPTGPKDKDLADFSALTRLRMLGLMDITILGISIPEEFHNRRVRTSPSEVNVMGYGIADWLGPSDHLSTWDLVMPRFRNNDDECLFGLFDGRKNAKNGCKLTKYLNDHLNYHFTNELRKTMDDDTIVCAMRRTFLTLQKELGGAMAEENNDTPGASAVMCYVSGTKLYVANVGDSLAILSRNNGQPFEITQKHIPLNPSETARIRAAGGYVTNSGLLNGELAVSRSFGHFHLMPVVNANPYISTIDLNENDEFVIMASRGLWDRMSYQTAVDIARTEKDDMMAAAQKLRDFALTYGAEDNLMVMVIAVGDLFVKHDKRMHRHHPLRPPNLLQTGRQDALDDGLLLGKNKRRGKEDGPGDSTLARLEREVPPPINQVALVFTDIKSSTQFWETQPENMRAAIKTHDNIMRRTLRQVGGYEVKTEGDAFMVCFQHTTAALLWCFTAQLQLLEADWPTGILDTEDGREIEKDNVVIYRGLSVRMGIHWGLPVFERNPITKRMDYFGPVVNKASRICNAADGGQICVSSDVVAALRNLPGMDADQTGIVTFDENTVRASPSTTPILRDLQQLRRLGFHIMELGERRLKGLETPEMLSLVYPKQLAARMELDKRDLMAEAAPPAVPTPNNDVNSTDIDKPPTTSISTDVALNSLLVASTPSLSLTNHPTSTAVTVSIKPVKRTIDPSLVTALSNLALRLERLTAGNPLSASMAGSTIQPKYTSAGHNGQIVSTAPSGLGQIMDRHIMEHATDEELVLLMENCVARVENAVNSLYLQKVGRFASALEKLGQVAELDPLHLVRALQMYSEVAGLDTKQTSGFHF
ncbi:hypothetical protein DM01DRAFT_1406715 [Hesseltinella vesiculosa]|uniref:Adenylate cyclase n=1 Tax=Hesseltinella vesiculosa TaxID=101127 RepID=A0A1X2GLC1_9FUNG|nr:hypothetical protein DM01DRAFT_1406715 [Hesseltinella vesiculosa]